MKIEKLILAALLSAACLTLAACSNNTTKASDATLGIHSLRQIVAQNNKTARTLMWQANTKSAFTIEYREKNAQTKNVTAKEISFKEANGNYIQYEGRLTNLKPGASYEYRITSKNEKGAWHELKTDDGKNFTALIFPDSQSSDYSGWTQLVRAAQKRNPKASFYINMGDLVDNGQDAKQWKAWFESVEPFSDKIPLAPIIGNHEAYSLDWKACLPVAYTHLFSTPTNGLPEKYPNQFYSFDYGNVHFTVIDTNFWDEVKDFQPQLADDQLAWLEKDLANAKAKWKIVLQHRDIIMYGFSPASGRPQRETYFNRYGKLLMPIYEKYQVDAVLSAHLHTYRRRLPFLNFEPNDKGITYILTGVAGNVRYPKLWCTDYKWDAALAPQPETANYMTMQAGENEITFHAFLEDGKEFDSVTIKK
ncbi:MAG: metallophosphoesterase family protein [Phascolarctobacterium sp.]|nr:metallophosphoesterase family protein [Phascolarctobacterium sp.]